VDLFQAIPAPVYAVVAAIIAWRLAMNAGAAVMGKMTPVINSIRFGLFGLRQAWKDAASAAVASGATQGGVITRLRAIATAAGGTQAAIGGLKAMGAGLMGMLGGPWGIAIGGATVGLMAFQQAQQNTQEAVDRLTESLDAQSGAATAATFREITKELSENITKSEEWAYLNSKGLGMTEAAVALTKGGDALAEFEARLDAVAAAGDDPLQLAALLGNQIDNLKDNLGDARLAWEANKAATEAAAAANEEVAASMSVAESWAQKLEIANKKVADATNAVTAAYKALKGILDKDAAKDAWIKSLHSVTSAAKEAKGALLGNSEGALALREAVRGSISSMISFAEKIKDPAKQAKFLEDGMKNIRETLRKNGVKPEDMEKYLGQYKKALKEAKTQARTAAREAAEAHRAELAAQANTVATGAKKMAAGVKAAAIEARTGGRALGEAVATGMQAGINAKAELVASAAVVMAKGAVAAVKLALASSSPSKVFIKIGKDIGTGLAMGMDDSRSKVEKAADTMAQRAIDRFKARAQNALDLAKSVKDSIVSWGGVTGGIGEETMSTDAVLGAMRTRAEQADEFRRQVKELRKLGLNSTSLQEIIAAGAEQGGQIAAALLAGGRAAVNEVNSLEKMIVADAAAVGSMAAQDRYGMTTSQARAAQQITIAKGGVNITFSSQVSKADRAWITREVDKAVTAAVTRVVREANR
jgi:DNA-binding transcriptional MerR regulator